MFDLFEHRNKKVKKLSNGQKKRVQMIRSLLINPSYLLCDEPTSALDFENAKKIMDIIKEISKKICVIIVTHDIAIAEKYNDVLITMEQGQIKTIQYNEIPQETLEIKQKVIKKGKMDYLRYLIKSIKSKPLETATLLFLSILMMCSLFFGSILYEGIHNSIEEKDKWKNGKNIIVSLPINMKDERYLVYDVYDQEDIDIVLNNVDGVIGYTFGETNDMYDLNCLVPQISYNSSRPILKELEDKKMNKQELNIAETLIWNLEEAGAFESFANACSYDEAFTFDRRNQLYKLKNAVIYSDESGKTQFITNYYEMDDSVYYENQLVKVYDVNQNSDLFLLYGNYPNDCNSNKNNAVISNNLANEIMNYENIANMEDLIGKEIQLNFSRTLIDGTRHIRNKNEKVTIPVTITGISAFACEDEFQVFLYNSNWINSVTDSMGWDKNLMKYQYINFITDINHDSEMIASQINQILGSKNSKFVVYDNGIRGYVEYQNPSIFLIYFFITCVAAYFLLICIQIFYRNRTVKEMNLLKTYGYHPLWIILLKQIFIFLLIGTTICCCLPWLCETMNTFALSLNYRELLHADYGLLFELCLFCIVLFMLGEVLVYVAGTKKRN